LVSWAEVAKKVDLRGIWYKDSKNLLHAASAKGHVDICWFLMEEEEGPGLHVNSRSATGDTPVLVAASEGHLPVLRYLLARGGDTGMPDVLGLTPLHHAVHNDHCDAMRLLLSKGAPVDPIADGRTPLFFAASKGRPQALGILLDHGADPNRIKDNSFSPLMMACGGSRSLECIKLLLQAGADVNLRTPDGNTALIDLIAAYFSDGAELKEAGAEANYPGKLRADYNS
ncbi:hypothetical protein EJB05_37183, partial [Eragrostis curvula]